MMKKYKALLFREWKITRKFYIFRSLLFLFFVVMFALASYVMARTSGVTEDGIKLNGLEGEGAYMAASLLSFILYLFAGVMAAEDNGAYKSDVSSGWLNFSWALPVTSSEKALVKYLFRVIVILIGLVLSTIAMVGLSAIMRCSVPASAIYVYFWGISVVMIIDLIRQFVIMHAIDMKSLKKIFSIGTTIFIVWGFLPIDIFPGGNKIDAFFENLDTMEEEEAALQMTNVMEDLFSISHLCGGIGILLTIVLLLVSFGVVKKGYDRRKG